MRDGAHGSAGWDRTLRGVESHPSSGKEVPRAGWGAWIRGVGSHPSRGGNRTLRVGRRHLGRDWVHGSAGWDRTLRLHVERTGQGDRPAVVHARTERPGRDAVAQGRGVTRGEGQAGIRWDACAAVVRRRRILIPRELVVLRVACGADEAAIGDGIPHPSSRSPHRPARHRPRLLDRCPLRHQLRQLPVHPSQLQVSSPCRWRCSVCVPVPQHTGHWSCGGSPEHPASAPPSDPLAAGAISDEPHAMMAKQGEKGGESLHVLRRRQLAYRAPKRADARYISVGSAIERSRSRARATDFLLISGSPVGTRWHRGICRRATAP